MHSYACRNALVARVGGTGPILAATIEDRVGLGGRGCVAVVPGLDRQIGSGTMTTS